MRYATFIDSFIGTSLVVAGKWAKCTTLAECIRWNINIICALLLDDFSVLFFFVPVACSFHSAIVRINWISHENQFPAIKLHSIWWCWHVPKTLMEYFLVGCLPHCILFAFLSLWFISLSFSLCIFAAFNYSGGYFNPVLATALKWGCSGYTNIDHILVYWVGACAGAILSVPLYKYDVIKKVIGEESLAKLKPKAD